MKKMSQKAPRKEFTDEEKARIYKRDRATCVFSGKSLWSLDYGACPLAEWDWVDHIKPAARGGKSKIGNGVCASYTYNVKKRANGADKFHLLDPDLEGVPSEGFFRYFGAISSEWKEQLFRLSQIESADWYFNRAVCHLIVACQKAYDKPGHQRKPRFYRNSALKKLSEFRKQNGSRESLEERGLVKHPKCEDVKLLLSMIEEQSLSNFDKKLSRLKAIYAENAKAMDSFWNEHTLSGMRKQAAKIVKNKAITPAVRHAVVSHLDFWANDPRDLAGLAMV